MALNVAQIDFNAKNDHQLFVPKLNNEENAGMRFALIQQAKSSMNANSDIIFHSRKLEDLLTSESTRKYH